jgi:hypothetical protein
MQATALHLTLGPLMKSSTLPPLSIGHAIPASGPIVVSGAVVRAPSVDTSSQAVATADVTLTYETE